MAKRTLKIDLTEDEQARLEAIVKKGADWRERDRAATILALAAGRSGKDVAAAQGLTLEAVRKRRRKWLKLGFAGLPDSPRSGAPAKLEAAHRAALCAWVEAEPMAARGLLTRLANEFHVKVSASTLRTELKKLGYVWKRTRYSLKKNATPSDSSRPASTSRI